MKAHVPSSCKWRRRNVRPQWESKVLIAFMALWSNFFADCLGTISQLAPGDQLVLTLSFPSWERGCDSLSSAATSEIFTPSCSTIEGRKRLLSPKGVVFTCWLGKVWAKKSIFEEHKILFGDDEWRPSQARSVLQIQRTSPYDSVTNLYGEMGCM